MNHHASSVTDHILLAIRELVQTQFCEVASEKPGLHEAAVPLPNIPVEPATKFLVDTLIRKPRLLARNGVSYLALRSWRKPIKRYQIDALQALKSVTLGSHIDPIIDELAETVRSMYGKAFQHIVPIPPGSSGKDENLAKVLAHGVASKLDIKYSDILLPQAVTLGKSHPIKSAQLRPYKANSTIKGNILILDDVATSGKHLEMATLGLRAMTDYCASVVWISD